MPEISTLDEPQSPTELALLARVVELERAVRLAEEQSRLTEDFFRRGHLLVAAEATAFWRATMLRMAHLTPQEATP